MESHSLRRDSLQQLVFFSECFQLKYSRNFLELKYDLTVVTLNSRTDKRQYSAAQILNGI